MEPSSNFSGDAVWIKRFEQAIEQNLSSTFLTNYHLAKAMEISNSHLVRKVKKLTGITPNQYVRQYRLDAALKFLQEGTYITVRQTASAVGFINVGYFNRKFTARFNISPFQVLKNNGWR